MLQTSASQELARRFNENEAVWERYEYLRARRRLRGDDFMHTEEVEDALDWLEAELQCRQTRAVGRMLPGVLPSHIEL